MISIEVIAAKKKDFGDWIIHILHLNGASNVTWQIHRANVALQEQSKSNSSDHYENPDIIDGNQINTLGGQRYQTTKINVDHTASNYSTINNDTNFIYIFSL